MLNGCSGFLKQNKVFLSSTTSTTGSRRRVTDPILLGTWNNVFIYLNVTRLISNR